VAGGCGLSPIRRAWLPPAVMSDDHGLLRLCGMITGTAGGASAPFGAHGGLPAVLKAPFTRTSDDLGCSTLTASRPFCNYVMFVTNHPLHA
jgi:hypothetical protein